MPAFARGPQEGSGPGGNGNSSSSNNNTSNNNGGSGAGSVAGIPSTPQEMSEERIAHMLSESGHMQAALSRQSETEASNDADSKSPSRLNCPSPFGKDRASSVDSQNRRLKKYENDDIPQEKVARIYQEELAKIMGRRVEDMRGPRDFPTR